MHSIFINLCYNGNHQPRRDSEIEIPRIDITLSAKGLAELAVIHSQRVLLKIARFEEAA